MKYKIGVRASLGNGEVGFDIENEYDDGDDDCQSRGFMRWTYF